MPTWHGSTPSGIRAAIAGDPVVDADLAIAGTRGRLAIQPQSPGLAERIQWGAGTRAPRCGRPSRG